MENHKDIAHIESYKEIFKLEPPESDELWGGIEDQLDIDDTWNRIDGTLQKRKRRKGAFLMILFLSISILGFKGFSNWSVQHLANLTQNQEPTIPSANQSIPTITESPPQNNIQEQEEVSLTISPSDTKNQLQPSSEIPLSYSDITIGMQTQAKHANQSPFLLDKRKASDVPKTSGAESSDEEPSNFVARPQPLPAQWPMDNNSKTIQPLLEKEDEILLEIVQITDDFPKMEKKKNKRIGLNVGLHYLIKNDNLFKEATRKNSLVSTRLQPGFRIGSYLDYEIHPNIIWRNQLEFSSMKQEFAYYAVMSRFQYVEEQHHYKTMGYTTGFGFMIPTGNRHHTAVHLGNYIRYTYHDVSLYSRSESLNPHIGDHTDFDMGIVLELEWTYHINKQYFSIGLHGSQGYLNVYKGDNHIPTQLNRTFLSTFGSHIGYGFKF